MEACGVYVFGSSESKLSKVDILRGLVSEKMTVAVREILAVVETTVAGYEEEVLQLKRELSLKKEQLDAILQPQVYLNRIAVFLHLDGGTSDLSSVSSDAVRHVQNMENSDVSEPSTVSHEETLEDQDEDCSFADVHSDSSVSCPAGGEKCLRDDEENDAQKTKGKRRRRLPKRYRSNNDETDSDGEKNRDKEWKPNNKGRRSSNAKKIRVIKLRVGLLEKCPDSNQSKNAFRVKVPGQTIMCQQNLSESDFFSHLRSTFPELGEDAPLEAVLLDRNKRSVPHPANKMTQTEIYRAFRKAEKHLAFYIQPKEFEDICDTPTTSHDHNPSRSGLEEQPPSETLGPSKLTVEENGTPSIVSAAHSEDGEHSEHSEDGDWKPEQNNEEQCDFTKSEKIRKKRAQKLSSDSCKVCDLSFQSKKILTKHALCHLDNPQHICGVCGQALETSEELKSHLETHQKLHQCETCGRYFVTFLVFQKHLVTCQSGKTSSADNSPLWQKINVSQKGKPLHKCDSCPQSFRTKTQLYFHKSKHTGKKPFCCDICGRCLSDYSSLYRHKLIHTGEKKHACTVCKRLFYSRTRLKQHQVMHFEREKNFLCDICSKTFFTKTLLMMHQRIHDESHIVKCPVCDKSLKGELDEHMRVHTGEKPYNCKMCGMKFRLRNHLRNHMNSHLGIKPYTCSVCGYKCSRNDHLKMHMSTHTGHKPYKCKLCDKAYTQTHCLKTHMKSHQTDEQSAARIFCSQ